MSVQFCDKETAIIRAARSGKWEPALRPHLDSCAGCREAANLVAAMNSLVLAESDQTPATPDPQRVWLKAAFAERQKRSAWIMQLAGVVYAVLAAAVGVAVFTFAKSSTNGVATALPRVDVSISSLAPLLVVVLCALLALVLSTVPGRKPR